ncbi:3'-5' exonuclease [Aureispira sp. CCB-E]|uniref:3'-5' exonuclease n=1 Tax=Aureispira sp. CCB-E TaxID=3051121 RepID=UPI0028689F56|nr:3'-5' exonuclease [Aureispira sp. CCB-E]WMX17156.1 3'-5' exonuclease [Aureispira sp. CCB-E]
MNWMVPEEKLSPEQRDIMKKVNQLGNQPIWIQGHAGSGKSVVMLYSLTDYLIRNPRAKVVVYVFTHALKDLLKNGIREIPGLKNRRVPVYIIYQLKYDKTDKYDAIFCDEVQDLPIQFINDLKQKCTQLIIAGDAAQSIYDQDPIYKQGTASIAEITGSIKPQAYSLNQVFRLTQNILDLLKNVFSSLRVKAHVGKANTAIRLYEANSYEEEIEFVWKEMKITNTNRQSEVAAILMFKRADIVDFVNKALELEGKPRWEIEMVDKYNNGNEKINFKALNGHLKDNNMPLMYIGNNDGSLYDADRFNKIVIMTYHSSKGLDFGAVALPQVNTNLYPTTKPDALALVALSRSKRDLLITYTLEVGSTFSKFLHSLPVKDINTSNDEILF